MILSPKRYVQTADGRVVEAAPGLSGYLVIAEGAEMSDLEAEQYGLFALLDPIEADQKPPPKPSRKNEH